ncbi:MAG: hypothetical protein IPP98_03960 [Gemmatimonadetes bacterium]|nr:hypothetical protein [Gemmatimonadota bacterium]MBL0178267.1 hypothetical protein [Gemmatimonadota bacterium]
MTSASPDARIPGGEGWAGVIAWSVALVIGQGSFLQLVDAGPSVGYQHLGSPGQLIDTKPLLLGLYVAYAAVVAGGIGLWARRRRWDAGSFPRRLVVVLLAVFGASSVLSASPAKYLLESAALFAVQLVALANVLLIAATLPGPSATRLGTASARWLGDPSTDSVTPDSWRWALGPAAFVLVVSLLLAVTAYQGRPHIPDEVAFYMQAKYFAHGLLWMPAPAVPAGFDVDLMTIDSTRWFSAMPPGWPAMLAAGMAIGAPWAINPILGAVNILLTYATLQRVMPQRTARIATLLLALSPWHGFLAMSYMSHAFSLTLALIAGLAMAHVWRGGSPWWCLIGGGAIGLASVNRPLEGVALAFVFGVITLVLLVRRRRIAPVLLLGLGTLMAGALGLAYNAAVTGRPLTFPVEEYFRRVYGPGRYEIGFGPTRGLGWPGLDPLPGHGAADVVINALLNLFQVNTELFGWACGSLGLVVLALVQRRVRGIDLFMWLSILVVVGLHSLFWFSGGPDFGARYWFLVIVPCTALAASGIRSIEGTDPRRQGRVLAAVGALSFSTLAVFYPWRATDKYDHYRGMSGDGGAVLANAPQAAGGLILVSGNRFPDFASMAAYNPVDVNERVGTIIAWDRDAGTRAALLAAYRGRPVWRLVAPREPRGAWLLQGPFSADSTAPLPPFPTGPSE